MAKPSPKPQPIGQNADGSYIYEQNMSVMPKKPFTPITSAGTGIPGVGIPGVKGVTTPIAPSVSPSLPPVTFSQERAQQINEVQNQPINDVMGIKERVDANKDSQRVKMLNQHFSYLKEKGLFELSDKQSAFIKGLKEKHPEYKNVNDASLYSKLLLADDAVREKYGNIGEKSFIRRLYEMPFSIAQSGGEAINRSRDLYDSVMKPFNEEIKAEQDPLKKKILEKNKPTMFAGGAAVLYGAFDVPFSIAGDLLNLVTPQDKYQATSTTELLSRNVSDIMVGAMNVIDTMSADGEGYSKGQIEEIVSFLEKNPKTKGIATALALGYSNLIGLGAAEKVIARDALEASVAKVVERDARKALGFIPKGPVTKDVFEAGMQRSLIEDAKMFSPSEFVKRQTEKLGIYDNNRSEKPVVNFGKAVFAGMEKTTDNRVGDRIKITYPDGGGTEEGELIRVDITAPRKVSGQGRGVVGDRHTVVLQTDDGRIMEYNVDEAGVVIDNETLANKNIPEAQGFEEGMPNAVTSTGEAFVMEDKPGMIQNVRDKVFYGKEDEDLAFRAVSPRQSKKTTPTMNREAGKRSLESLEQLYNDARTGKINSNIDTMVGGADGIEEGLGYYGKIIGDLTEGSQTVDVNDIATTLKQSLTDPKTKLSKDLRGLAETIVEVLGDDKYISGISIKELQEVISTIKSQIFSDKAKIAALTKETAGRNLSTFLEELGKRFEDAVENATGNATGLREAKAAFSKYKRIQQDYYNSLLVQERSVKGGLSNLAGTAIGIAELLKNPTPGGIARAIAMKWLLQEIGISKSRGGAYEALIRSFDRKALSRNLPKNVNNLFDSGNIPDSQMGKGPEPVATATAKSVPVNETPGQNLVKVTEIKNLSPDEILKRYNELDPKERAIAIDGNRKVADTIKADQMTKTINEYKGDFGVVKPEDIEALSYVYRGMDPDVKEFIRKKLGKEELTMLQEINRKNLGVKAPVEVKTPERKVLEPGTADYERAKGEVYNPMSKTDKKTATNITAAPKERRGVIVPDDVIEDTKMLPPGSPVWKQMQDGQYQDPKGYLAQVAKDLMTKKEDSLALGSVWDNGQVKTSDELFAELNARGVVSNEDIVKTILNKDTIKDENLLKLINDFEKTNDWTNLQYADDIAEMKLSDTEVGLFRTQFGEWGDDILESVRYMHKAGRQEATGTIGKTGKQSKYLTRLENAVEEVNSAKGTDFTPDEVFNIASDYLDEIRKRKGKFQTVATRYAEAPEISAEQAREILGKDFPVTIVDRLETPEGKKAMGMYYQGAIEIANNPVSTTGYHEAFHAWAELYGDETVLKKAFDQVKRERGYTKNIDAEEYLAEAFAEWKLAGKGSYTGAVKQFFQTLWNDIKGIIGKADEVLKMFKEVGKQGKVKELQKNLAFQEVGYQSPNGLTTKVLEQLQGRQSVSKEYIQNLLKSAEVKQVERDIFTEKLANFGDKVDVGELSDQVRAELLPLTVNATDVTAAELGAEGVTFNRREIQEFKDAGLKVPGYESTTLPESIRGEIDNYQEKVYESPIRTSAGYIHSGLPESDYYFGHTRIEDMADGDTRRVIEVQSDLYQKNGLGVLSDPDYEKIKNLKKGESTTFRGDFIEIASNENGIIKYYESGYPSRIKEFDTNKLKLKQYTDPTAHFRMVREEIAQAAKDGKTKLQFPTGETAMKVEGLGQNFNNAWTTDNGMVPLRPYSLKIGMEARNGNAGDWIITNVLGDGKFKAVPKRIVDDILKEPSYEATSIKDAIRELQLSNPRAEEVFDISGKVDTNNPIYKFYENDMQKYLKKFDAKRVTDDQGVEWFEVPIKEEYGKKPVQAFQKAPIPEIMETPKILDDGKIPEQGTFGGIKGVQPKNQVKYNQGDNYEAVRLILSDKDAKISRYGALITKSEKSGGRTVPNNIEMKQIEKELGMNYTEIKARAEEIKKIAREARSAKEEVIVDLTKTKE